MKRIIVSLIFACLSMFVICARGNANVQASAANNEFTLEVEKLTTALGNNADSPQAGDFRVTVNLSNSTGYAGFGFKLYYSNNFVALTKTGQPKVAVQTSGNLGLLTICNVNAPNRFFAVSAASPTLIYNDGTVVTLYLRPVNSSTLTEAQIQGMLTDFVVVSMDALHQQSITDYSEAPGYTELLPYMIGDITGDGLVNIADAIALMSALNNHSYTVSTAGNHFASCYGMYVGENNDYFIFAVGDVNGDGFINSGDTDDILEYYNDVYVAGFDYNGDIATTENYTVPVTFS